MTDLEQILQEAAAEAANYQTCMSLYVSEEGRSVELILDTGCEQTYSEWIPGEGADICLIRELETKRLVGVHLPLLNRRLVVSHEGPIRINAGFRKVDSE